MGRQARTGDTVLVISRVMTLRSKTLLWWLGVEGVKTTENKNTRPQPPNSISISRPTKDIAMRKISWNNLIFALISFKKQSRKFTTDVEITQKGQNKIEYMYRLADGETTSLVTLPNG
jgi:hypothetical protein